MMAFNEYFCCSIVVSLSISLSLCLSVCLCYLHARAHSAAASAERFLDDVAFAWKSGSFSKAWRLCNATQPQTKQAISQRRVQLGVEPRRIASQPMLV